MAKYRKLNREKSIRKSILAGLTKDVILNESIVTTEARAKEVRKFVDKMITYGKKGTLVSRRKALSFLNNDKQVVGKVFDELAKRYETNWRRCFNCKIRTSLMVLFLLKTK